MEEGFYRERLLDHFGIETILPKPEERKWLHSMIFDELTVGKIRAESGENLVQLIEGLSEQGAEGVILGCTELALLISQKDTPVPLFDTTDLHAKAAVDAAL